MVKWCICIILTMLGACSEDAGFVESSTVIEGVRLFRVHHRDGVYYGLERVGEDRWTALTMIPDPNDTTGVLRWMSVDKDNTVVYGEVQSAYGRDATYYFIVDESQFYTFPSEQLMRADLQHRRLYATEFVSPGAWLQGKRPCDD
jgi:hypothetical protein